MTIHVGDCRAVLADLAADSIDAVVTDPPYHLTTGKKGGTGAASLNLNSPAGRARISTGFMGQTWDGGDVAFRTETWAAIFRVLKPGGYVLAFGGTRTYHRLVCAIEDAGFEIRDQIGWAFGTGFPKSLDVSKAIDKASGSERECTRAGIVKRDGYGEDWDTGSGNSRPRYDTPATPEAASWQGWGTALKPAWEPIVVARKPLVGTVAANVLAHGTGALNIDATRVSTSPDGARSNLGGSTVCTSCGRAVSQTGRSGDSRNPVSLAAQLAAGSDLPTNGSGCALGGQPPAGSQDDCRIYPRSDDGPVRGDGATDPEGAPQRSDARTVPGRCHECGHIRGAQSMSSADDTARHVERQGRWPANLAHDGSDEVMDLFPETKTGGNINPTKQPLGYRGAAGRLAIPINYRDPGSAARFFYCAKASKTERNAGVPPKPDGKPGNDHPTVKPLALMQWLVRLVTPPGGIVLDPFAGSGSTGVAALREGFRPVLVELSPESAAIARRRMETAA
jgi:DNA modification methylase